MMAARKASFLGVTVIVMLYTVAIVLMRSNNTSNSRQADSPHIMRSNNTVESCDNNNKASNNTSNRQFDYEEISQKYKAIAIKWRRAAGEMSCKVNPDGVGPTGGWCLLQNPKENWGNLGKAAIHHVVADSGLAKGIAKYIAANKTVSVFDVGAGVGQYGHWFRENNVTIEWMGFDGAENIESFTEGFVTWIDVTDPLFDTIPHRADWIMSLEIGEHIPPEFTNNLIDLLDRHNRYGIILSWGIPGQGGHAHINLHTNQEIIALLAERGYFQDSWTAQFQNEVRESCNYGWFKNTFMVFKRSNPVSD